jgi:hypothetical protein
MKVIGKIRIFKNEFNGKVNYSTSISNKKEDGTYDKMYLSVQFKKGMETEGDIDIKDGFLSFFKTKEGLPKLKLVILDYAKEQSDFIDVPDGSAEELPF